MAEIQLTDEELQRFATVYNTVGHEEALAMAKELLTLRRFKAFVHAYLDQHGVPADDPENQHSKEGCRIGARLDLLLAERDRLRAENTNLREVEQALAETVNEVADALELKVWGNDELAPAVKKLRVENEELLAFVTLVQGTDLGMDDAACVLIRELARRILESRPLEGG